METVERCPEHQRIAEERGDALVETVEGPVAQLREWGRQRSRFPDRCPGLESAHYSLYFKGEFVADTSAPKIAEKFREMALLLNEAHDAQG